MTLKPVPTSSRGKTSYVVITMTLKFSSVCRKEGTFPVPLNYIDVTKFTYTDLDVMQEKRVDDYWSVDSNRSVPDSVFTKFTLLKEKPRTRNKWSKEESGQNWHNFHS